MTEAQKPWEQQYDSGATDAGAEPWKQNYGAARDAKPVPKTSLLDDVKDSAIALGTGVTQGIGMLANVAGADNAVSRTMADATQALSEYESPHRKAEKQERARKIKEAEESGSTLKEVGAYLGSFAEAPIDTTLNALGTSLPTLAAGFIPGAGQAAVGARIAQLGLGAAQGVGAVKGQIFDEAKQAWKEKGATEEDAAARAAQAQSYTGDNAGSIALGGALGAVAGSSGAEAAVRRMAGKEVAERAAQTSVLKGMGMGALKEAPMEGLQGGQERLASNLALQNEGFDQGTWTGVAGGAALEATASAPMGAGFGAWEAGSQQRLAQLEQQRRAEIEQQLQSIPEHQQPAARAQLNAELNAQMQAEARAAGLMDEEQGQTDGPPGSPSDYRATPAWAKPPADAAPDYGNADDEIFQSTGTTVDPVREAVRQAADAGGALSAAAGVAMDSGAAPTFMPPADLMQQAAPEEDPNQGNLLGDPTPTLSRQEILARIGDAYNPPEQAVAARAQPQAPVAEQASIEPTQPSTQSAAMPVPGNFSGTPSATMGARTDAVAGPGFGATDLQSALAQIRARKQQTQQPTEAQTNATTPINNGAQAAPTTSAQNQAQAQAAPQQAPTWATMPTEARQQVIQAAGLNKPQATKALATNSIEEMPADIADKLAPVLSSAAGSQAQPERAQDVALTNEGELANAADTPADQFGVMALPEQIKEYLLKPSVTMRQDGKTISAKDYIDGLLADGYGNPEYFSAPKGSQAGFLSRPGKPKVTLNDKQMLYADAAFMAKKGKSGSKPKQPQGQAQQEQAAPTTSAQAAPQAEDAAQRIARTGDAWTRMPTVERQALAQRADLKPIVRKNVHRAAWGDLNVDVQRKLAEAMAPAPQTEAAAQDAAADQVPVKQETRASAGSAPVRQGGGQETADDLRALAAQFRERYQQTGQDTDRTFAAVIDRFAGEVEQGKRTRASFAEAEKRYREMLGQATNKDPDQPAEVATPAVVDTPKNDKPLSDWQSMTPDQRRRTMLEREIATGKTNNGGVEASLRPSAIDKRKQELADMGERGKMPAQSAEAQAQAAIESVADQPPVTGGANSGGVSSLAAIRASIKEREKFADLQQAMRKAKWFPEVAEPDNTIWTRVRNRRLYTASLNPDTSSMEITVPEAGVNVQIASFSALDSADAAVLANKAIAADIAERAKESGIKRSNSGYAEVKLHGSKHFVTPYNDLFVIRDARGVIAKTPSKQQMFFATEAEAIDFANENAGKPLNGANGSADSAPALTTYTPAEIQSQQQAQESKPNQPPARTQQAQAATEDVADDGDGSQGEVYSTRKEAIDAGERSGANYSVVPLDDRGLKGKHRLVVDSKENQPQGQAQQDASMARTAAQRINDAVRMLQETRNSMDALVAMHGDGLDPDDDVIEVIQRAASGFDAPEKKKLNKFLKENTKRGKKGTYITNERQFFDLLPEQFGTAQWLLSDAINDLANESQNQPPAKAQQAQAATENVAEAIPIFERYDDAMAWMKDRAKSQGLSVIAYRATDEFKNALSPQLQALYAASKSKWDADTAEAGKAMQDAMAKAGIRPGDTVQWNQPGAFLTTQKLSGVVKLDRFGVPHVHMSSEVAVAKAGGKIGYTKKLRWQPYMQKPAESASQAVTPVDDAPRRADTAATDSRPAQEATAAEQQKAAQARFGRDNVPLSEGGKPFKTRKAAGDAKKLQPMMRVVTVPGGYALAEKTPAQLAAEERASRRLRNPSTSARGEPIPAHAFIAAAGGLNRVAASDMGVGGNPRIGNRTLFAGQGRGLSMEQATQMLIQEGYLSEGATINDALALIKKSLTQPQYNADGIERIAQAEADARFDDYLTALEEAAIDGDFDPFGMADDFTADELDEVGYTAADPALQAEVDALTAQVDAMGIDTYEILEDIARTYANATQDQYNAATREALAAAIARGNQDGGSTADQAAPAAEPAAEQGLNQPSAPATLELSAQTPAEAAAQQDAQEQAAKAEAAAKRAADAAAKAEEERKRIAQASVRAADSFELGQDPLDSLTGQGSIFDPANSDTANFAASPTKRPGSAQDKAVMQAIADGKNARDVLRVVASGSKDPFLRQVAKMLLKAGITPNIQFGHIGKDKKGNPIHGQYRGKSDTIAIAGSAEYAAERIFMHEAMHAATMRALKKGGLARVQLQKLMAHVQKQKGAAGFYGMQNVDEFVAEVFTNPDFQAALRKMSAPAGNSLKSAWHSFVRILRSILGLSNDSSSALAQALELGVEAVRQDMVLRRQGAQATRTANAGQDGESEAQRQFKETERAYGGREAYDRAKAAGKTKLTYGQWVQVRTPNFKAWFGDWESDPENASKVVDPDTGETLVVYHGTASDFFEFQKKQATDKEGRRLSMGWGSQKFYFATYPGAASSAAEWAAVSKDRPGNAANVMPVYLRIENPISGAEYASQLSAVVGEGMGRDAAIKALDKRLMAEGYDGIVDEDSGGIAVFDGKQVKSATGNNGNFDPANQDIRRSFAGQQAATADTMALATAQQRLEAGEDAETVRQETGWHKGVDGKWRFEINDADARLKDRTQWTAKIDGINAKRDAALQALWQAEEQRNDFLRARGESPSRISSETKKTPEFKALAKALKNAEAAAEKAQDAAFLARQGDSLITVGDVLSHPALFAAYPGIADVRVDINDSLPAGNAAYAYELRAIELSGKSDAQQLLSTLLHEIQHGIQHIEGFAMGGTPKGVAPILEKERFEAMVNRDDALTAEFDALKLQYAGVPESEIPQEVANRVRQLRSEINAIRNTGGREASNPFARRQPTPEELFAGYRRLAGEVEARNTQARQNLTDAQRRATPPSQTADVADSDVIVMFNGKVAMSAPTPANAAPDAAPQPPRTPAATIRAAINRAYGKLLGQLEAKGLVTLAQTEAQAIEAAAQARAKKTGGDVAQIKRSLTAAMQGGTDLDVKRSANGAVQGFFDPQTGQSFLIADNLSAEAAPGVLMHEVGIHMAADGSMKALFNRAALMLKAQKADPFMRAVQAKLDAAGETSPEEVSAYLVEAYENQRAQAPASVKRWLADLLATVKAWLYKNGIVGADSLTVADVAAVARANAKSMARGDVADNAGTGDIQFSRASQAINNALNERKTVIAGQTSRAYTPEQQAAMRNVGLMVEQPSLKERAQALWQDAGKKLAQGIVDQFAPVKEISKYAYALLRLSKGASGAFETLLKGGKLKLSGGVYDFDEANKGGVVDALLTPLNGEHHDFLRWVAANRAERLMGEDRERLFTPDDIAALKTLADGQLSFDFTLQHGPRKGKTTRSRAEAYKDSLTTFNAFNKNVLDMAEQSGLIDKDSRATWESEFYVPFYRVADEESGGVRGMNIKGSVVRQQAFKHLKGGKQALNNDLLDNTLMNWAHLLDASAKNRAAKATLEAAQQVGVAIEAPKGTLDNIASAIGKKNGIVWFMDGGQKRHFIVDDPYIMTAISSLEYAGMNSPIMNAMGAFKHALTIGVTASPFFKIRNLIRDSVQVVGTSSIGTNPLKNVADGWKLTDPKNDAYFRLLAGGGTIHFGTMLEGSEAKRVQALVESGVQDSTILNTDHKVKQFYRKYIEPGITAYNELGNRGEAVNRAALYDQLRKQGMGHAEASLQARDLMDFSMQGSFTSIRFLSQVVPFLNARLQGMYKLGRAANENPKRMAYVTGAVAMASLALLAAYGDDDDWKRREDWDRNNFWWFKVGGIAFRIPKPFELGAIGTLAERSAEYLMDDEMTGKRFRGQVLKLLGDNLSMNPIPQAVKPLLDVYANKDSFRNAPIESMGMERMKSEYRFNDRTSMVARGMSTAANSVTGLVGAEALSPVQIDHLLRGYFGWLGTFAVGTADMIARPVTNQPTQATQDIWKKVTGGIASQLEDAPSRYVSSVYDQAKELEQAYGTWRALQKSGKPEEAAAFFADNREEISRYRSVTQVKSAESKLNERIRQIERNEAMDGDQKREEIRRIRAMKEALAKQLAPA